MSNEPQTLQALEDMSLKELHAKLAEQGFSNPQVLPLKKQAIAVLQDLLIRDVSEKEETKIAPVLSPREGIKSHLSKAEKMRKTLEAQPEVQVYLALEGKERQGTVITKVDKNNRQHHQIDGAVETAIINGHTTYIPKGRPFLVPQQVAELIGQAQADTAVAGQDFLLSRDEKVQEMLS